MCWFLSIIILHNVSKTEICFRNVVLYIYIYIYIYGVTLERVQKRDGDVVEITPFERNCMVQLFVFSSLFKHLPAK